MSRSEANLKQHGGAHYMLKDYQHWDWATDISLHYLLGCASKYLSRWKEKNGLEDLKKADHYLEKAIERDLIMQPEDDYTIERTQAYVGQFGEEEAEAIMEMILGNFEGARTFVRALIAREERRQ